VLYTANEIDKRASVTKQGADCEIRKLDALTGELLWEYKVPCIYHYYLNGGALATPLVGQNDISDLIIFNVCLTSSESDGKLIALDKATGSSSGNGILPPTAGVRRSPSWATTARRMPFL
jgi:outer membrane protein assembly factor BamB